MFYFRDKETLHFVFSPWCLQWYEKGQWRGHQTTFSAIFCWKLIVNVPFSETQLIYMFWIAMSTKIWSLIIVSVKTPPTGIYRAKQSSVFKRLPCLPGSWHMIECAIFVITGQFCAGWCTYYFTSSRSQNRIMTCYEWPRNYCALTCNGEVTKLTWPKVTDIKNLKYTNCRHLCPYWGMRVSESSDHWCAFGKMSNFEKRSLRSGHLMRPGHVTFGVIGSSFFRKCVKLLVEYLWQSAAAFSQSAKNCTGGGWNHPPPRRCEG